MFRHAATSAVAGVAAALLALTWTGSMEADVGPGRVQISTAVRLEGGTMVELPPLGQLTAATHAAPLRLKATVLEVDVDAVQLTARGDDPLALLEASITDDLAPALRWFAWRTLALSAVAGAVGALLLPGRRWWTAASGAVGGTTAVALLLGAVWAPYDRAAFEEPTFHGELVRVPGLLDAAERNLGDLEEVRGRVDAVSDRLASLYAASAGELPGTREGDTSILHVSDLYLNPLAAELVVQLADDLEVDAVLDTGDVTTFGLAVEAQYGQILSSVEVPYLLVPGNHDSPLNRAQLAATDGITVLDGEVAEVGGVRILGVADPTFTATNEVTTDEARLLRLAEADEVAELVEAEEPDVLAVHDRRQAEESMGGVPLVVAGHLHESTEDTVDGTLVLTVGSTGATGLEEYTVETRRPYEAQVLRFRDGRLIAIDYLTVQGIGGDFTLERRLVDVAEEDPDGDAVSPAP
jgi:Icc-related predicted phosphoesterase